VANVKCGLCEINKNNRTNATRAPSPVKKMFRDRTEANKVMLDWRGPVPGPGPVLTLLAKGSIQKECKHILVTQLQQYRSNREVWHLFATR